MYMDVHELRKGELIRGHEELKTQVLYKICPRNELM